MQSGAQALLLQRQSSPQRQLGLQAQPAVLDVAKREAAASFIVVSMGLGI